MTPPTCPLAFHRCSLTDSITAAQHLHCTFDMRQHSSDLLRAYRDFGECIAASVILEVVFPDDRDVAYEESAQSLRQQLAQAGLHADSLVVVPASHLGNSATADCFLPPGAEAPEADLARLYKCARSVFPGNLGGGASTSFTGGSPVWNPAIQVDATTQPGGGGSPHTVQPEH